MQHSSIHLTKNTLKNKKHTNSVSLWSMGKVESIEEFYKKKFDWMPDNIRSGIGHFNIFKLDPFVGDKAQPVPYKRRDYYKIMLVKGNSSVQYADKEVEVKKQALSFSNPQIPYKWNHLDQIREGYFCIFFRCNCIMSDVISGFTSASYSGNQQFVAWSNMPQTTYGKIWKYC